MTSLWSAGCDDAFPAGAVASTRRFACDLWSLEGWRGGSFHGQISSAPLDARGEPWKRGQEVIAGKDAVGAGPKRDERDEVGRAYRGRVRRDWPRREG